MMTARIGDIYWQNVPEVWLSEYSNSDVTRTMRNNARLLNILLVISSEGYYRG